MSQIRTVLGVSATIAVAGLVPATAWGADAAGSTAPSTQPTQPAAGVVTRISDEQTTTRWANPYNTARIHRKPNRKSKQVGRLRLMTEDGFPEVYVVLAETTDTRGAEWARIRIPARPNGKTGWVNRDDLGEYHTVHTKLLISRRKLRATLFRNGRKVFSARVGVGKASTPTPAGQFWIREKFQVRGAPVYGPRAFGTSAYAPTLTEWPNGGVVGLHGTNEPSLVPGRPSHGCIRFHNADILRLYKLVPVGTPLEIV
jgi:hypothetical protein